MSTSLLIVLPLVLSTIFCQKIWAIRNYGNSLKGLKRPEYHEIRCFIENDIFPKIKRKKR